MRTSQLIAVVLATSLGLPMTTVFPSLSFAKKQKSERAQKNDASKRLDALQERLEHAKRGRGRIEFVGPGYLDLFGVRFKRTPFTKEEEERLEEEFGGE